MGGGSQYYVLLLVRSSQTESIFYGQDKEISIDQIKIILADKEEEVKGGEESILKITEKVESVFWFLMDIILFTWMYHVWRGLQFTFISLFLFYIKEMRIYVSRDQLGA